MKRHPEPAHPIHGVSVVCRRNNRFLLIKRKKPPYQHWLAFPGGKVKKGETPQTAAKRELYEETGLFVTRIVHLVTLDLAEEAEYGADYFLSVYHALDIRGNAQAADDALSLHWLTLAKMEKERVIPSVHAIAKQLRQQTGKCKTVFGQPVIQSKN